MKENNDDYFDDENTDDGYYEKGYGTSDTVTFIRKS